MIPGLGKSLGGGHGNPLQDSHLENHHGQRSLVGYNPLGNKELDRNDQLSSRVTNVPAYTKFIKIEKLLIIIEAILIKIR